MVKEREKRGNRMEEGRKQVGRKQMEEGRKKGEESGWIEPYDNGSFIVNAQK
jgi:hypothetical protein